MFDQLLLLSEGRTIYLGPAANAGAYFATQHLPPPSYFNPADFYLDMLSPDNRSKEAELTTGARIHGLSTAWKARADGTFVHHSPLRKNVTDGEAVTTVDAHAASTEVVYSSIKPSDQKMDFNRFVRTVRLLMWRSLSGQLRVPQALIARTVMSIAFGGIIGGMYSNLSNDQRSIQQL